ncbi:MAG: hypothetical protein WAW17_14540 [Rhodococcus sp. (in: high G+C Gram-positive bacteria)]|uniref:hypothetical protein n=1 Tax=Rhodococcus sp. TaxID=1831 RepID=UPI003BB09E69
MASESKSAGNRNSGAPETNTLDRKVLLTIDADLKARMVAAIEHTRARTGITSQQVFIRTAIAELCTKLEEQYNDGNRFPPPITAGDH